MGIGGFLHEFGAESSRWCTRVIEELLDGNIPDGTSTVRQLCKMHMAEAALAHEFNDFQLLRAEDMPAVGVVKVGGGRSGAR